MGVIIGGIGIGINVATCGSITSVAETFVCVLFGTTAVLVLLVVVLPLMVF